MISDTYYLIKATAKYIVHSPDYDKDIYNALMRVQKESTMNEPFVEGVAFEFKRLTGRHVPMDMLAEKCVEYIGNVIKCKRKKKITSNKYSILRSFLFNNMVEKDQFLDDMSPVDLSYYIENMKIMNYPTFIKRHIEDLCKSNNSELLFFSFEKAFSENIDISNKFKKSLFMSLYNAIEPDDKGKIKQKNLDFLGDYFECLAKYVVSDPEELNNEIKNAELMFYNDTPDESSSALLEAMLNQKMYENNVSLVNHMLNIKYEQMALKKASENNTTGMINTQKKRL